MAQSSKERYYAGQTARLERNRRKKAARYQKQLLRRAHFARGSARAKRRQDMKRFNTERIAKLMAPTGTIKVTAPSLQMLGKFIGRMM